MQSNLLNLSALNFTTNPIPEIMLLRPLFLLILITAMLPPASASGGDWFTYYERHYFNRTPSYDETVAFSQRLAAASPMLHYGTFGESHQRRGLPLLVLDKDGYTTPEAVHASGRLVLLVKAGIHAGEPVGKDAGLVLLRNMVIHGRYLEMLEDITLVFIPIFNVDGHERFGPYNRINQNGPEEMGWRTNARNLNLNRDYLKADSREMQHFIRLWNQWQPDFFIDTHSTNGGDYQYTMTYILETSGNMDEGLTRWCEEVFLPGWGEAMEADGYPVFPYVTYRQWHDPRSGLVSRSSPPALSNGYAAVRNRPGLLLETHMLKPYRMRVESTYLTLVHTMDLLQRERETLKALVEAADAYTASTQFRAQPLPLDFRGTADSIIVEFKGVEYQKKTSTLTGGQWFIYDSDSPRTFEIPWFKEMEPIAEVTLPEAYIIPVQWYDVIERLAMHGVEMHPLERDTFMTVESYEFDNVSLAPSVNEGRQTARFDAIPVTDTRWFPAGSVIIPSNQPGARLIAHALEPVAPSSFAYWGFFNAIFQRVEYFESYVMEAMAREMLAADERLRQRFEEKMQSDQAFANNPRAILNWFYEQTPYYDQKHNVYPVGRIMGNR
jgi:hypothetical protein